MRRSFGWYFTVLGREHICESQVCCLRNAMKEDLREKKQSFLEPLTTHDYEVAQKIVLSCELLI